MCKKASVSRLCKLGRKLRKEGGGRRGEERRRKKERKVVRKAGRQEEKRKENKKSMGSRWGSNRTPGPASAARHSVAATEWQVTGRGKQAILPCPERGPVPETI